jgi:DNA polymerase III delta' subunit
LPFRAIIGHRRLVSLLSRAVARDTVPPSLLLAGPEGVGKRRVATALVETLNCLKPIATDTLERDACGECAACRRIARGIHPDVIVIEPGDSGSIKIDPVRDVVERAQYRPFEGRRRVVIVDYADALTEDAQSALLKILEEPPSASAFLLVSPSPDTLLPTVRSRCPRLRFGPLAASEIAEALVRDHGYDEAEARAVAADADGSLGRALDAEAADLAQARATAQLWLTQSARGGDPAARVQLAQSFFDKKSIQHSRNRAGPCGRLPARPVVAAAGSRDPFNPRGGADAGERGPAGRAGAPDICLRHRPQHACVYRGRQGTGGTGAQRQSQSRRRLGGVATLGLRAQASGLRAVPGLTPYD